MRKLQELVSGCFAKAGDEEMIFVLLSRDEAAPATILFWINERVRLGKNQHGDQKLLEANQCAKTMEIEKGRYKPKSQAATMKFAREGELLVNRGQTTWSVTADEIFEMFEDKKSSMKG